MKVEMDLEEYLRFFDMKEYRPRAAKHEVDEDYVSRSPIRYLTNTQVSG